MNGIDSIGGCETSGAVVQPGDDEGLGGDGGGEIVTNSARLLPNSWLGLASSSIWRHATRTLLALDLVSIVLEGDQACPGVKGLLLWSPKFHPLLWA